MKTRLLSLILALTGAVIGYAQTDVTDTYLSISDWQDITGTTFTSGASFSENSTPPTGWTKSSGNATGSPRRQANTNVQVGNGGNRTNFRYTATATNTYAFAVYSNATASTYVMTRSATLDAGTYRFTLQYAGLEKNGSASTVTISAGGVTGTAQSFTNGGNSNNITASTWSTTNVEFTIASRQSVTFTLSVSTGTNRACIFFDKVTLEKFRTASKASFEYAALGTASTTQALTNGGTYCGWNLPDLGANYVNISIGNASTCNGQARGIPTATDGSFYYYARRGWNNANSTDANLSTSTASLPIGYYLVAYDYKGADQTGTDHMSAGSYLRLDVKDGGSNNLASCTTSTFVVTEANNYFTGAANWQKSKVAFQVTSATAVTLDFVHHFVGGVRTDIAIDNIRLYQLTEELYRAYLSLEGYIKKAKALNSVMQDATLTAAIATAESGTYTTVAQIETQIAALQTAWEAPLDATTPMINILNGTFDNPNVAADGSLISGVRKEGTATYSVPNWLNVSEGGNSYANTTVFGTNADFDRDHEGLDVGVNNSQSPSADMFGQTTGGALHLSSGWNNPARYQQTLPTLPAGRYIIYYEANNKNTNANANSITDNYIGINNVAKGNIAGSNNTFVFSALKNYTYNEWTATAFGMVLGSPQEGARLNIGVSNNNTSPNFAKLWIDNVELYYLGWDATSALDALQTMINAVAGLNTSPMNKDVCQNMIDKRAIAQDVYNTPAKHTYEQITSATLALQQAISNAEESVAEYVRIKARIDQMNTADQRGDIEETDLQTLPFYTKYSDGGIAGFQTGTYVSYDEVMTQYRTSISNWWATRAGSNSNLTAFVINQGFELGNTEAWDFNWGPNDKGRDSGAKATNNATYQMTNTIGNWLFNTWADTSTTLYIEQEMEGLPNGFYTIKAIIGAHEGKTITLTGTTEGAGNTAETTADVVKSGDKTVGQEMTLDNVVVNNGKLTLRFENTDGAETFFKLDNVRIYYKTTSLPAVPDSIQGIMRAAAFREQYEAYTAWNGGDHSIGARARVIVAHDVARVSHEAYLAAERAVTRVEALLNNTNVYTYDAYVKFYDFYNIYKAPFDDRTLADNLAAQMEYQIFGNRSVRQKGVPVVEFLGSAWDHAGDYMWDVAGNWQVGFDYNKDASHNYWVNTWSPEGDTDGSDFKEPFMEYWYANNQTLADNTLTAVVKAVPGSDNTVTAWVRARISDGQTLATPAGITLQVAPENDAGVIDPANIVSVTPTWTRIGSTRFYQAHVTLNNGKPDPDSDGDGFGDLRIQFVINSTNASWFSFRDVKVTYGDVTVDWDAVDEAIKNGKTKRLGFWGGEYAPYTNIKALKALEALEAYKAAHVHSDPVNDVLVNSALYTLNGHPGWIENPGDDWGEANPQEMNAVAWRTNYTKSEIVKAYDYDDNGDISYTFETIIPDGWDLNGRSDGYDTRLMKYGVNTQTGDVGVFANCDSIAMFFKRDTRYGEQLGYTMPLKPGTKYSLTFTYTNWAKDQNEANSFHDNDTYIIIHEKDDPNSTCQVYYSDNDENPSNDEELDYVSQGAEMDIDCGNAYAQRWKAVRAYFTTPNIEVDNDGDGKVDNIDMVIEFSKSIKDRQIQMALGEVYILKYREQITLDVNGQETTKGDLTRPRGEGYEGYYEDGFLINTNVKACNITLTRTLKAGQWNSLCLPVKIPYKDMQQIFQVNGKQAVDKVYIYTGTTRNGIYEVLNFTARQGGIQAGQPVLVKPYNYTDNTELNENVVLVNVPLKNFVVKNYAPVQKDPNHIYDFVGVYGVYNVQQWDVYTKYNTTEGRDELIRKVTSDQKTWLQPTRAFFRDVSVQSGLYSAPGEVKLWAFNIDDVETGIMAVEPDGTMTVTSGNIYDLKGRLVRRNATTLEGLPQGIYVVDGRKVMVR